MQRYIALGVMGLLACARGGASTDIDAREQDDASGSMTQTDAPMSQQTDAGVDATQSSAMCGNGTVNGGEACDDSNTANDDGCSSACALEPTQTVTVMNLNMAVTDNGYNGTLASMACANVPVTAWYTPAIASMTVIVGASHNWVGDVTVKLVHPDNTTVTLVSRPGVAEPADDGTAASGFGASGVLQSMFPFKFETGAANSAEQMGVGGGVVCNNNADCPWAPANGSAAAGTLANFNTKTSTGTWKLCMGDSTSGDVGTLQRVTLTFQH